MGTLSAVLVGQAQAYISPANTATPVYLTTGKVTQPIVTPAGWAAIGFTEGGVTLNVNRKTTNIMVEEQSTPALVVPDTTDITVDIAFSEDTVLNMQTAYGGGTITTIAAASGTPAQSVLTLADALTAFAIAFIATNSAGLDRLVYIPNMISGGAVKTTYSRAKAKRSYAATFTAVCAVNQIVIKDATAAGT